MPDQEKPKRKNPVSWRPPASRQAEFDAMVSSSGLSANAFLTEAVFGKNRYRPAELQKLARILALEQAQSDALRKFNEAAPRDPEIKSRLDEYNLRKIEIRSALFELMGRKP